MRFRQRFIEALSRRIRSPMYEDFIIEGYEVLWDDASITILYVPATGANFWISFTGIGKAMGGINLQAPEFAASDLGGPKLFIIDNLRSWGEALNWERLQNLVEQLGQGRRLITLGNSMGGYLAILAAARFSARRAIAFAPQWSASKKIIPKETRWQNYRDRIGKFRFPHLAPALDSDADVYVFFGDDPQDAVHAAKFAEYSVRLKMIVLSGGGHNVARFLKERNLLYPLIAACAEGHDPRRILDAAGLKYRLT